MKFRLVTGGWSKELTNALRSDASELKVISPFIKEDALGRLLSLNPSKVRVITRFNLGDWVDGVSDVEALRTLLDVGAHVRGIKDLHAKLYLFGDSRAVITSANLTKSGLDSNHEFGLVTEDKPIIAECRAYFDKLWRRGNDLAADQVNVWEKTVTHRRASGGRPSNRADLEDFGADTGVTKSLSTRVPTAVTDAPQAFVKFLGKSDNRISVTMPILEELKGSGCHWALPYPRGRRPRSVQDGAVMFISLLTDEPDIRIFGRAVGKKYVCVQDDATTADIKCRPWKETWPRYIRVHHVEFVAGTMANGVSLYELMDALGANSFESTKSRAASGEENINPKQAYRRHPAVKLSPEGFRWLSKRLQAAFDKHGKVSKEELRQLDWPVLPDLTQESGG